MMKLLIAVLTSVLFLASCGGGETAPSTSLPVVVEQPTTFEIELVQVMVRRPSDNTLIAVDVSDVPKVELTLVD